MVKALKAEGHRALATPRQLARFLCGLASPATTQGEAGDETRGSGRWPTSGFPGS